MWARVAAGGFHTCGVRTDRSLWCWGDNGRGQLGLGDRDERNSPARVGTGTSWASLVTGYQHTCATRVDHTLWCWGWNRAGQLGLGETGRRPRPNQVGTDTDWANIGAAGYAHTCGIRTDHTLWCWGSNVAGQLGLGDTRTGPPHPGRHRHELDRVSR